VLLLSLTMRWFDAGDDWKPKAIADAAVHGFPSEFNPREQRLWTSGKAASAAFPLSRHLTPRRNPPQRTVRDVAGCSGVAYVVQGRTGALGTLLVLNPRATLSSFPTKPPKSPQADTAGRGVMAGEQSAVRARCGRQCGELSILPAPTGTRGASRSTLRICLSDGALTQLETNLLRFDRFHRHA